jgi:hypothetical protein
MIRKLVRSVFMMIVLASCETQVPPKVDIATTPTSSGVPTASIIKRDTALGEVIGYRAGDDTSVTVLLASFAESPLPDTLLDASAANGVKVDLFGPKGFVASAVIRGAGKAATTEGCFELPRGRISPGRGEWEVALSSGRATGLPLVSLSELQEKDSLELTEELFRLAATAPGAQDSTWRDQKWTVERAVRFTLGDAVVVAGSTLRMIPGPDHFSETTFVVGERAVSSDSLADKRPFVLAYSHRTAAFGRTDEGESGLAFEDEAGVDALVITKSNARPTLLLETRGNETNGFAALGRVAPGQWRIIWNGGSEGGC